MTNEDLTPAQVKKMSLAEFETRFGFRPTCAFEKHWFAGLAQRPTADMVMLFNAGLMGPIDLSTVVME